MRKISAFNFISVNGFLEGAKGDISWHRHGSEENEYAVEGLRAGNILLFGRITYELMSSYWPTPMAIENDPIVAEGMNQAEKIVFSKTLKDATWSHTRLMKDNIMAEMQQLKQQPGKDMILLGSGSILTQFAENGLIDEYQIMIDPVTLGKGTTIFKGIHQTLSLKLTNCKTLKSGVVLLTYQPNKR